MKEKDEWENGKINGVLENNYSLETWMRDKSGNRYPTISGDAQRHLNSRWLRPTHIVPSTHVYSRESTAQGQIRNAKYNGLMENVQGEEKKILITLKGRVIIFQL